MKINHKSWKASRNAAWDDRDGQGTSWGVWDAARNATWNVAMDATRDVTWNIVWDAIFNLDNTSGAISTVDEVFLICL